MENPTLNKDKLWRKCPPGLLQQVVGRGKERCHKKNTSKDGAFDRRRLLQIAAAVAVTSGAGTIAYRSMFAPVAPAAPTALSCTKCISLIPKYLEKSIEDQQLVAQMDKHLGFCPKCQSKLDMMQNS